MHAPATSATTIAGRAMVLNPQVALRDESFGALAYHYGTRRLVFLKSRELVDLVRVLGDYPSVGAAIAATIPAEQHARYEAALDHLATSGVLDER
jgi:putative mycofactocin binding protein MftB